MKEHFTGGNGIELSFAKRLPSHQGAGWGCWSNCRGFTPRLAHQAKTFKCGICEKLHHLGCQQQFGPPLDDADLAHAAFIVPDDMKNEVWCGSCIALHDGKLGERVKVEQHLGRVLTLQPLHLQHAQRVAGSEKSARAHAVVGGRQLCVSPAAAVTMESTSSLASTSSTAVRVRVTFCSEVSCLMKLDRSEWVG